jgi:hypothetical protein
MRYELTDGEWAAIKPMLPNKPRGVPRVNDRRVLNGIFFGASQRKCWRRNGGNELTEDISWAHYRLLKDGSRKMVFHRSSDWASHVDRVETG